MTIKDLDSDELNDLPDEDLLNDEDDLPEDDDDDSSAASATVASAIKEEDIPKVVTVDEEKERLKTETAALKAEIAAERAAKVAAIEEASTAKRTSLQSNIDQAHKIAQVKRDELVELQVLLKKAEAAGDGDAAGDLVRKMAKINQDYNDLDGNVRNWNNALNNLQASPGKVDAKVEAVSTLASASKQVVDEVPAEVRKRGGEWAARNTWYDDPAHSAKREKAQSLYNELVTKKYNPATEQFWKYMDTKLVEFDKEPETRRSAPPLRPIGNSTVGGAKMSTKKEIDKKALAAANKFMEMRGANELNTKPEKLKKMKIAAYNTAIRHFRIDKNASA